MVHNAVHVLISNTGIFEASIKGIRQDMKKTSEAMRQEMLEKPMGRLLLEKSYPTVIIQLITVIYNTADTYFVAKLNTESAAYLLFLHLSFVH